MMEDKSADFPRASSPSVFHVELRPGETTIVSWKKLLRDASNAGGSISSDPEQPSISHPSLEYRTTTGQPAENEVKDAPAPHRFSAVIEKIERLYMDEYFEVDNSEIKHDGFFINRGQLEHRSEPTITHNQQMRKRRKKALPKDSEENGNVHVLSKHAKLNKVASGKEALQKNNAYTPQVLASKNEQPQNLISLDQLDASGVPSEKKSTEVAITLDESSLVTVSNSDTSASHAEPNKLKMGILPFEISHQKYLHKKASVQPESHFVTPLPDNRASNYPTQTTKTSHMHKKDGSSIKPKGAMLERAIRELERIVAETRPPSVENQETDSSSQIIKKRLPTEVKLKLARVARFALASHGKLTNELINRRMSILGHFMQLRTLKRNLKAMVSKAKQEKDDRFQQIKKEVTEMINTRITSLDSKASDKQTGRSDDFQVGSEGKRVPKRKLSMDTALEDKICDLYDLFVDGLDADAGPLIRKLYTELAELWPSGMMNSHGIRHAICRAKEKRRTLYSRNKDEKIQKKKVMAPRLEETIVQPHQVQEKVCADSDAHGLVSIAEPVSTDKPKPKKVRETSGDNARVSETVSIKKVKKRKPGIETYDSRVHAEMNGTSRLRLSS